MFYPKAILVGWTKLQDMLEKLYTMSFHVENFGFCPLQITLKYSEISFRFFFYVTRCWKVQGTWITNLMTEALECGWKLFFIRLNYLRTWYESDDIHFETIKLYKTVHFLDHICAKNYNSFFGTWQGDIFPQVPTAAKPVKVNLTKNEHGVKSTIFLNGFNELTADMSQHIQEKLCKLPLISVYLFWLEF